MTIAVPFPEPAASVASPERLAKASDRQAIASELSDRLGCKIIDVAVDRVHFSGSRPVQLHYSYRNARSPILMRAIGELVGDAAEAHRAYELQRLSRPGCGQLQMDRDDAIVALPGAGVVLRRPGIDARLPGLRLLHSPSLAAETLARIFELPLSTCTVKVELAAHRLGKRAVLAATIENRLGAPRRVFIRLRPTFSNIGEELFEKHRRVAAQLSRASKVVVPKPIHFDKTLGAAFVSALPGGPFDQNTPDFMERAVLAGRALAEWRGLATAGESVWTSCDEITGLDKWARHIAGLLPRMAPEFHRVLQIVASDLYCLPTGRPEACHRDFHEGQLLFGASRCGILDFDTWCLSDRALDIGNFAAHLRFSGIATSRETNFVEKAFVEAASGDASEQFLKRVRTWKRATLLRLAAIYAFTSTPKRAVKTLLAEAAS